MMANLQAMSTVVLLVPTAVVVLEVAAKMPPPVFATITST
jgi:hypothetical protein